MKKIIAVIIAAMTLTTTAFAQIRVVVNGINVDFDVPPEIINDRTMVPVRAIFEFYNMNVLWNETIQEIHAYNENTDIVMNINSPYMKVNNREINMDVFPVIKDNRTLVPLRAISEALNKKVSWSEQIQTVFINEYKEVIQQQYTGTEKSKQVGYEVLEIVNKYRNEAGLSSLEWDDKLANCAFKHSADMVSRSFFNHVNPDGLSPFDRMKNNNIRYSSAGENIAAGQPNAEFVMNSWMNSEGHRKNIMNPSYKKMGIGFVEGGKYGYYWTQCFTD